MSAVDNILELTAKMMSHLLQFPPSSLLETRADYVRLPRLVEVMTDGGRISEADKIAMGKYVKSYLLGMPKYVDYQWQKIPIDVPDFVGGVKKTKTIVIVKYTEENIPDLTVAIAKFLVTNQTKIIY
ncbi:hypothetical protein QJ857_gp0214 [Tupanvirus soda lake]|uniref:Uncharacterized protein n=2 Tax=Tupanvirus TaxID=2094720 RepID=A0A6N1NPM0_9VIRU|nr:hypothetical protein QJ857_gp0214 [Tupanvirus soda lake]QKU35810.1 hypothetical protein [Tupanvirus soda lake]